MPIAIISQILSIFMRFRNSSYNRPYLYIFQQFIKPRNVPGVPEYFDSAGFNILRIQSLYGELVRDIGIFFER